jgi:hypothetical protein
LTRERQTEHWISDIVGVFCDPIIVMPGGWGDTLPDWIKGEITLERLIMNVQGIKGEKMTATDAEACAYLYTANLTAPISHDWAQVYFYVAGKTTRRHNKDIELPEELRVESLTASQQRDLDHLKDWIYKTRTRARQEKERAERREHRQEETAKKEELQPRMFDF